MSRTKLVALIIATILVGLLIFRLLAHKAKHHGPAVPVPVRVVSVIRRNVPISLQALGTVQAFRLVTVQPMITGPMISVNFHQGMEVRKGQLLARIDPRPYKAALSQALAKRAEDEAIYAAAQDTLKRYDLLTAHHYISAEIVAGQEATVAEDKAIIAQDQAAVRTARTNLGYTEIRAPISGRTGILAVNAGNIVNPGLAGGIVTIATLRPIYVLFSLPQQDLGAVAHAFQDRHAKVTAYTGTGLDPHVVAHGRLAVMDNSISQATGTLSVKALFKNPRLALWPGAFVNVRLQVRTEHNVLVVPSIAVRQGLTGPFVYVIRQGRAVGVHKTHPTVAAVAVGLGFSDQHITVITSGLRAGDKVVTVGASRLRPHASVRILAAAHPRGPKKRNT